MPLYEHTKSKRRHRTNAGSTQDKRLAASSNYRDVDAKPEPEPKSDPPKDK